MLEILERISAGEGTARRRRPARAAQRRRHRRVALPARRQRPQPRAHHAALLPRRGHGARGAASAARPRSAGRSSATASTRTPAPAATSASAPAPPTPSAASASRLHVIDQKLCIKCDTCRQVCKFDAVPVETGILDDGRREAAVSPQTKAAVQLTIDGRKRRAPSRARPSSPSPAARASTSRRCATRRAWPPGAPAASASSRSRAGTSCRPPAPRGCRRHDRQDRHAARARTKRESYLKMYLSDHNAYCEAPCSHACPTHIDIPAYMAALADGDAAGAAAIVREELPFPGILGRVCPRYCEPVCRRGEVDEPIAICALHRAAADHSEHASWCPGMPTGRRVAVIGAGPAGLTAAWYLTERGHEVTIYDTNEKPGGSLRYSIPEFRLPEKVARPRARSPCGRPACASSTTPPWASRSPSRACSTPASTPSLVSVGAWQTGPRKPARRRGRASTASTCCARCARAARSARRDRRRHRRRHQPPSTRRAPRGAWAPSRSPSSPRTRPSGSRPAPATSPPPSRRASRSSSASLAKKVKTQRRQGPGRRVRARRRARRAAPARSRARASTWPPPP